MGGSETCLKHQESIKQKCTKREFNFKNECQSIEQRIQISDESS